MLRIRDAAMLNNPFQSPEALANSDYHSVQDGRLQGPVSAEEMEVHVAFREFVLNPGFPCVAAKAALHQEDYRIALYDELASPAATAGLSRDLATFVQEAEAGGRDFLTFVAVFSRPVDLTEEAFEQRLWAQLTQLNRLDVQHFAWDQQVSPDPDDPHFSFSFAGRAFYIVGLHAQSSRQARRFRRPALVFNLHEQFERLRAKGKYDHVQHVIRARDEKLQGSINPMLSNFGDTSEARQYSGRAVQSGWHAPFQAEHIPPGQCPFHRA